MSSRSVDERIVEMKFNNAQFERNCRQSINTIDDLNTSIDNFSKSKDFFKGITDSANNVDLSGITKAMDAIQHKFSVTGTFIDQMIRNISNSVYEGVKNVSGTLTGMIKSGGLNRALNIKQAQFQLEGLKVAWDDISKDINYAVEGTAYGLDAAAIAASQLVASGVKFGETFGDTGSSPMAKALRGISGVAAMTNAEFSEISPIFTTVAGQGKLMTMQLRQLEARGLNAAATIGNALGVTEAEVRDMVTQGEIDFNTFANAMDSAFGEHAKDANKTFKGALSNMKAAMSKIGADFYLPALDEARDILNALRLQINNVRASIEEPGGMIEALVTLTQRSSQLVQYIINSQFITGMVVNGIKKVVPFINTVSDAIYKLQTAIVLGELGLPDEENFLVWKLGQILDNVKDKFKPFTTGLNRLKKAFDDFSPYVKRIFDNFKSGMDSVETTMTFLDKFQKFTGFDKVTENFNKFTERVAKDGFKIKNLFDDTGAFDSFDSRISSAGVRFKTAFTNIRDTVGAIFGILSNIANSIGDAFSKAFGGVTEATDAFFSEDRFKGFEHVTKVIKDFFESLRDNTEFWSGFTNTLTSIFRIIGSIGKIAGKIFSTIGGAILKVVDSSGGLIDHLKEIPVIGTLIDGIVKLLNGGLEGLADNLEAFANDTEAWSKFKDWITKVFESLKSGESIFDLIGKAVSKLTDKLGELFGKLGGLGSLFGKETDTAEEEGEKLSAIGEGLQSVGNGLESIGKWFNKNISKIAGGAGLGLLIIKLAKIADFIVEGKKLERKIKEMPVKFVNSISGAITTLSDSVKRVTKYNAWIKVAASILILTAALKVLSSIKPDELLRASSAITVFFIEMLAAMKYVEGLDEKVAKSANVFMSIGASLLLISFAMSVLTKAFAENPEAAVEGLKAVMILIAEMAGMIKLLQSFKPSDLAGVAAAILAMAVAIDLLTVPILIFGKIPWEQVMQGIGYVGYMMIILVGALSGLSVAIKQIAGQSKLWMKDMLVISVVMITFAAAINMLVPAVMILGALPWEKVMQGIGYVGLLALIITGLTVGLSAAAKQFGTGPQGTGFVGAMLAMSAAMIAMAFAINLLLPPLLLFAALPIDRLLQSVMSLSVLMITMSGALALVASVGAGGAGILAAGAGILLLSVALNALMSPLLTLTEMKWDVLGQGLLKLAALVGTISALAAGIGLAFPFILIGAATFALFTASIWLLCAAFDKIGDVGADGAKKLEAFLVPVIVMFAALSKQIEDISPSIILATVVLGAMTLVIYGICAAFSKLGDEGVQGIDNLLAFLEKLEENMPRILELVESICLDVLDWLIDFAPQLAEKGVELIISLINGMANAIDTHHDEIVEAMRSLVVAVMTLIPDVIMGMIGGVFEAAAKVFGADEGFAKAIGDFIEDIPEHMGDIIGAIVKGIGDRVHDLWEAGKNALQGFLNGFTDKDDKTGKAGKDLGEAANKGAMKGLKEHSPSRTMYQIGEYAVMGLANGIIDNRDKVMQAMENIGKGMNQIAQQYAVNLVKDSDSFKQSSANIKKYQKELKDLQKKQKKFGGSTNYLGEGYEKSAYKRAKLEEKIAKLQGKAVNKSSAKTTTLKSGLTLTTRRITGVSGAANAKALKKFGQYRTIEEEQFYKDQISNYSKQIAEYKKKQKELSRTVNSVDRNLTKKEVKAREAEELKRLQEYNKLQAKIDNATKKQQEAANNLKTAKGKEKDTNYYVQKEQMAAYKKQLKEVKEVENAMSKGSTADMEKTYEKTAKKISDTTTKTTAYKKQIDDLTKSNEKLQKKQKKLNKDSKEYKDIQKQIDANNKKINSLNKKVSKNDTTVNNLKEENEARQKNIDQIKEYQDQVKQLTEQIEQEYANQALEALKAVQEEHDKIKDSIKESLISMDKLLSGTKANINLFSGSVTNTTRNMLKSMEKQITKVTDWEDKLRKLSMTNISDGLFDAIEQLGPESKEIDTFLRMTSDQIANANSLYQKTADMTSQSMLETMKKNRLRLTDWNNKIQQLASRGASKALLEEIVGAGVDSQEALNGLLNMTDAAFSEFNSLYSDANTFSDTMADSIQKAYIAAEAAVGNFTSVGENMTAGVIEGLIKSSGSLEQETREMALSTYEAACRVLGIHSPSRKFQEIGQYIVQGFILGMTKNSKYLLNENSYMMNELMQRTQYAANWLIGLSDRLSADISPTIRPRLNTSMIYADVRALNSLLNDQYAYNAALAVNSKLEFSRRYDDLMNELIGSVNGANNKAAIIAELNNIAERIAILDGSITGMQVVMDSGALVGSISTGMDTQLNRNMKYAERGM